MVMRILRIKSFRYGLLYQNRNVVIIPNHTHFVSHYMILRSTQRLSATKYADSCT
jgi:hypothetical protein